MIVVEIMDSRTSLPFRGFVICAALLSALPLLAYEQGTYLIFRLVPSSGEPVEAKRIAVDGAIFQRTNSAVAEGPSLNADATASSFLIEMNTFGSQGSNSDSVFEDFGGRQSSSFLGGSNSFEQENSISSPFGGRD